MKEKILEFQNIVNKHSLHHALYRSLEYALRWMHHHAARDPKRIYTSGLEKLLSTHNINICYNYSIPEDYNPSKTNILIATESPAVVEYHDWIQPQMEFEAEISLGNFCDLDNYYCPRHIYAGADSFVQLDPSNQYKNKTESVSIIYSDKTLLPGHKLRHKAADKFRACIDEFGSGADRYVSDKRVAIEDYRFTVVIENGKYDNYVSEKFYDSLKTMTVPIYWGGEDAIRKMGFNTDGIIFFDTIDELGNIISSLSRERYQRIRSKVEYNRERLIEIRNRMKNELYLSHVRTGYLTSRSNDAYHLKPEK